MVYFVKSETTGLIKIGYCGEKRFNKRLKELGYEHSDSLTLIGVIHLVKMEYEKELHKRFEFLRVRNEWFSPGEKLIKFMFDNARDLVFIRESARQAVEGPQLLKYRNPITKVG